MTCQLRLHVSVISILWIHVKVDVKANKPELWSDIVSIQYQRHGVCIFSINGLDQIKSFTYIKLKFATLCKSFESALMKLRHVNIRLK